MRMAKTDQAARMRSSCCRNTSAQPYRSTHERIPLDYVQSERGMPDKSSFRKKTPHSQVYTFCLPRALLLRHQRTRTANRIYPYNAEASLNENVFVQPYQNDTVRIIRQHSGISAE